MLHSCINKNLIFQVLGAFGLIFIWEKPVQLYLLLKYLTISMLLCKEPYT